MAEVRCDTSVEAKPAESSLSDLTCRAIDYARALAELVASEAAFAKGNLPRLAAGVLIVPALALAFVISFDALLVALAHRLLGEWSIAIAMIAMGNLGVLVMLLRALRSWWRSLTLPRSRAAFTALWSHPDEATRGPGPTALGTG